MLSTIMPRAKAFDPDTALDRAVELFWRRGYDGASMTMLLEFMGISRQSLYDTFLDKHHLYLAAIDRYRTMLHEQLHSLLNERATGRDGIRAVFELVDREVLDHPEHRSCLLANAALELGQRDGEVRERVAAHLAELEELFYSALERDRVAGAIEPNRDTRAQARCLTSTIHGLGVLARGGADRQVLQDTIASTLAMV
jgi:TetR/AcrR family transcriptional repressor of nem operon